MAKKKQTTNKNQNRKENKVVETVQSNVKGEVTAPAFFFNRDNYILLGIGLLLIIVGFLLMMGGGSDDPNVFSDKIFNRRRLTVAPILILAGYVVEIFAIMRKPKN